MSPKAGAHGELCGLLCIRAALEARGDAREVDPRAGKRARHQPGDRRLRRLSRSRTSRPTPRGRVDLAALKARLGPDVAAVMITNPNTCGLFEPRHDRDLATRSTRPARLVYCDGANFNAIVGRSARATSASTRCTSTCTRPSRPRTAAAGRARGRWCCREALAPFAPLPFVEKHGDGYRLVEEENAGEEHRRDASAGWSPSTARWACSPAR